MAITCTSVIDLIKARKKLLFLLVLVYMTGLLLWFQGHTKLKEYFSSTSTPVANQQRAIQKSIRYIIHNKNDSDQDTLVDIHLEHPLYGHTGEVINSKHNGQLDNERTAIAIGGGLTSAKLTQITKANIPQKFQLFTTLLPSFCKTATKGFDYHFYFAFDKDDPFFKDGGLVKAFHDHFDSQVSKLCHSRGIAAFLHLMQCSHNHSPGWAQNDAMIEAYQDGATYFYRINDDSQMNTGAWTEAFLDTLKKYEPALVGVVGPKHQGGNMVILTYDFVHRTHIEIFGFYYPRLFTSWWADDWVTKVYQPGRSTKLPHIKLIHTMRLGQRYHVDGSVSKKVNSQINNDKKILQRYLQSRSSVVAVDGRKVISMSLYGRNTTYTWGAIRNAQLVSVYYPGWALRVYISDSQGSTTDNDLAVPQRVVDTLLRLGAQVAYVKGTDSTMSPAAWRYLVADDSNVDYFLIRGAQSRFSDREAHAVDDWLKSDAIFHCMRDHPLHKDKGVIEGAWGAKRKPFMEHLGEDTLLSWIQNSKSSSNTDFLLDELWPRIKDRSLCHDSVACDKWPRSKLFAEPRVDDRFITQAFTGNEVYADDLNKALLNAHAPSKCQQSDGEWPDGLVMVKYILPSKSLSKPKTTVQSGNHTNSTDRHKNGSAVNVTIKPEVQVAVQPEVKVPVQPEVNVAAQPEVKAAIQPEVKNKPEVKVAVQPEVKVAVQPEVKVMDKPEVNVAAQPEVKAAIQPEVKDKPEVKVAVQPELKDKAEVKVAVQPEVKDKAEVKVAVQPEVKDKPEVKDAVQPEVKVSIQPGVKKSGPISTEEDKTASQIDLKSNSKNDAPSNSANAEAKV